MKKMNFSGNAFKQLGLNHGEKAVFAVGLGALFAFVYAFFGRVTLSPSNSPEQLKEKVRLAQDNMQRSVWDQKREQLSITDYVKRARWQPLAPEGYALRTPLNGPISHLKHKRPDPPLLAVESIKATGGVGAFAMKDGLRGQRWAMVTGLTPVKKQIAAYEDAFKDTIPVVEGRSSNEAKKEVTRDVPVYDNVVIERSEVTDENDKNFNWQPIDMVALVALMEEWSGTNPEVVSLDYVDGVYTMPLGPLTSGAWDENAAHLPEIPLATETDRLADEARAAEDVKAHEAARIESAKKGFGKAGVSSNRGAAPKTNSANTIRKGPDDRVAKKTVDYRLFRFADYGVEPNKRYRYRVQLVMVNPNYDLPDKLLKNIDSKLSEKRTTPWSEPSPMVEMPRGEGLLVGGPKPPARGQINPEPSATILVYTVEPETGLEAAAERQVSRGSVLNFKSMVSLHNPTTKKTEERAVAFDTGALILDIQGGREMRSSGREKLLEPSEVLLLDGNSRLVAHSEMDDLDLYAQHSPNASEEAAAAPTRPGRDEPAASPGKKKSGGGGGNILDEKVNTGKKK